MSMYGGGSSRGSGPNRDARDVPPLALRSVHGTTNVGLATKMFQILAVDGRLSTYRGSDLVVDCDDDKKLFEISQFSNIYCTAAGTAGPWDRMYYYVKKAVSKEEQRTGNPTTAEFAMKMVYKHCSECEKEEWTLSYNYEGIIAGWPTGGVPQMYQFVVKENIPRNKEILLEDHSSSKFKNVAVAGSGLRHAASHMAKLEKITLKDEVDGANRCLESVFRAGGVDPNTGGRIEVGCLKEGSYSVMFSYDALDAYSHCYAADYKQVLFLFVPGNRTLTAEEIKNTWSWLKIRAAHCIAVTKHFAFHRILFVTVFDRIRAEEVFCGGDEPDLEHISSPQELLSALPIVKICKIHCRVSKKSKSVIDLICRTK